MAPDLDATGLWAHVRSAGRLSRGAVENTTGYSVRTLIAALWAVLQGATAEVAIVLAANLGGGRPHHGGGGRRGRRGPLGV